MNTVRTKLEYALKAYVEANFQDAGSALELVTLLEGMRSGNIDDEHRVIFRSRDVGGPHARQGNYEIGLEIEVITNANEQSNEDEDTRRLLHEGRVEELAGIFGEEQVPTVVAGITTAVGDLGCSAFWGYDRADADDGENFRTVLRKTFEVYLIAGLLAENEDSLMTELGQVLTKEDEVVPALRTELDQDLTTEGSDTLTPE